jgi:pyrophosphatase PpaX
MKHAKAVLFDWDGTIAQTMTIWIDELQVELQKFGLVSSRRTIAAELGTSGSAERLGIKPIDKDTFWISLHDRALERLKSVALYDHTLETLEALRERSVKLALVSSSPRTALTTALTFHGLESFFDATISGDDVVNYKPDPEPFLKALDELKVDPSQSIIVGDTEKDLQAAQRLGVPAYLHFPEGHHAFYDLAFMQTFQPAGTFGDWRELIGELKDSGFLV